MSSKRNIRLAPLAVLLSAGVSFTTFSGCESEGPAEQAGKSIDKGIQNAKDAVNPPGPGEKLGRDLDKAVKP